MRANDVDAKNLVVFLFRNDLYKTVGLPQNASLARSGKRKLADFYIVSGFLGFGFGQADARNFGVAIGAVRYEVMFDRLDLFTGDLFDDKNAFLRRKMCKLSGRDHVADRVDSGLARFTKFIDLDGAAVADLHLGIFEPEPFEIRHTSNCHQQHFRFERYSVALGVLAGNLYARFCLFKLVEFEARLDLHALFLKSTLEFFRDLGIFKRHDAIEQLDERNFSSKPVVDAGKLAADCTRTHYDERFRHSFKFENVIGIHDLLSVGLKAGNGQHYRASCDDDVFRVDRFLFSVSEGDLDLSLSKDLAETVINRGLVLLHQIGHAGRVFCNNVRFIFLNTRPVIAEILYLQSEVFEFARLLIKMCSI